MFVCIKTLTLFEKNARKFCLLDESELFYNSRLIKSIDICYLG